jgi:hypothetical protein
METVLKYELNLKFEKQNLTKIVNKFFSSCSENKEPLSYIEGKELNFCTFECANALCV